MIVQRLLKAFFLNIARYLPLLRDYFERDKKLNFLARELVFEPDLFTPVRRRQAVRNLLERLAARLSMQQGELLDKLNTYAHQPTVPNEAYRFRLACRDALYGKRRLLTAADAENILSASSISNVCMFMID